MPRRRRLVVQRCRFDAFVAFVLGCALVVCWVFGRGGRVVPLPGFDLCHGIGGCDRDARRVANRPVGFAGRDVGGTTYGCHRVQGRSCY